MMKLKERFIFPPRPLHDPVPFDKIGMYARYSWVAQVKVNDLHTEFSVSNNQVEFFNRRGGKQARNHVPNYLATEILEICNNLGFGTSDWTYLDGGLVCCKNQQVSGLAVIWDVLVRQNDWLLGTTYQYRYDMIAKSFEPFVVTLAGQDFELGLKLSEHVFVPRIYHDYEIPWQLTKAVNAAAGWSETSGGEAVLEGCVVKDTDGLLKPDLREKNNDHWSARSRIYTKRHRF
jgi:hypothetical protein